ncbi:MAG: cytochrome c oxidase assembly factor Coa1 family protein [Myxococcales bacterium]|nr:cytochrome c oxidase assembly factor Coa1 family protein [Myxococcales bacterium]
MTPGPNAPPAPRRWFKKNLKWLIPVGCVVPVLCCGVFGTVTLVGVSAAIRNSSVYAESLARASASDEVKSALGTPITPGFLVQGSIEEANGVGEADLEIPLEGPRKAATLYVVAKKRAGGAWEYTRLEVDLRIKRVDLLEVTPSE